MLCICILDRFAPSVFTLCAHSWSLHSIGLFARILSRFTPSSCVLRTRIPSRFAPLNLSHLHSRLLRSLWLYLSHSQSLCILSRFAPSGFALCARILGLFAPSSLALWVHTLLALRSQKFLIKSVSQLSRNALKRIGMQKKASLVGLLGCFAPSDQALRSNSWSLCSLGLQVKSSKF